MQTNKSPKYTTTICFYLEKKSGKLHWIFHYYTLTRSTNQFDFLQKLYCLSGDFLKVVNNIFKSKKLFKVNTLRAINKTFISIFITLLSDSVKLAVCNPSVIDIAMLD